MLKTSQISADLKSRFAAAVRERRHELGLTQEELAWRAGLHRTYLANVEVGAHNPSLKSIEKLAVALKVSIPALFSLVEKRSLPAARRLESNIQTEAVEILLVEDNPDDVELTLRAFSQARFTNRVQVATDGAAALAYLLPPRRGNVSRLHKPPQLILLDLGLPKLSGLEVLARIRADERIREIPVIVLTVSRHPRDYAECRRLGVEHYILKPVGFGNLSEVTPRLDLDWELTRKVNGVNA